MDNGHTVLEITNILPPYRVPLYRRLSSLDGIELTVLVLAESEPTRNWRPPKEDLGFDYRYLPGQNWTIPFSGGRRFTHLNVSVVKEILSRNPDVVVLGGYAHMTFWLAWSAARLQGIPLILRNGTTLASSGPTGGWRGRIKSFFVNGFDGYVTYGSASSNYLIELGVDGSRIHAGYNTVDMEFFRRTWKRQRKHRDERTEVDFSFLFVGRYLEKKGIRDLLAAYRSLRGTIENAGLKTELRFVGHGPLAEWIEDVRFETDAMKVLNRGFREPEELPREYALGDCLVLPSREEPWGLVVNEALACGLTVVCSSAVGCVSDLIAPHWNGHVFTAGNVADLAECMRTVLDRAGTIRERREEISRFAVQHFGLDKTVQGYRRALADLLESPILSDSSP